MPNQYKPLRKSSVLVQCVLCVLIRCGHSAPLEDIENWIETYFNLRLTDAEIVEQLKEHYDTDKYSLGCVRQI
jgi:hypothetical protein